ncbi:MAG: hypothetical protein D6788_11385 [Planctomycetota bacterium]|nr:MAG: hypothetical protein D6788_11385 [Planctomycetota bacterium]
MKRVYALIFARYPQPGAVKTRMCPPLDEEEAARLHTRCLQAVYRRVLEFPSLMPIVAVTPDERVGEMRSILAGAAARGAL